MDIRGSYGAGKEGRQGIRAHVMGLIECVAKDLMEHENDGGQGETARATSADQTQ